MSKAKVVEITGKLVELLSEIESEDRLRSVQAAFTLLGETPFAGMKTVPENKQNYRVSSGDFLPRVNIWMEQNEISADQLSQVFHLSGDQIEIIATVPGRTKNDQSLNAYILQGLANFVSSGNPKFEDKAARAVCEKGGFFNSRHHSEALAAKGNKLVGSKLQGWTLTDPGLQFAGKLVKQIAPIE